MVAPGRLIAILLAIIMTLLFPLQYIAQEQEAIMDEAVQNYATEFTDKVRHQGYITVKMYEELISAFNKTGELYDICFEIAHPISGKKMINTLGEEIPQLDTLESSYYVKHEHFHIDNNEEYISELQEVKRFLATHSHINACYNGDAHYHSGGSSYGGGCYTAPNRHYHSGNSTGGGGCYTGVSNHRHDSSCRHSHSISCYTTHSGWKQGSDYRAACPSCGKSNQLHINHLCGTCGVNIGTRVTCTSCGVSGFPSSHTVLTCNLSTTTYNCGKSEGTTYYTQCGYSDGQITGYSLTCGKTSGVYYNSGGQSVSPTCDQVVISITATIPVQTVDLGEDIVTTATATYLDGHTAIINCTSDFDPNIIGYQSVSLSYNGLVDNARTSGTKSCTMVVTVKDPVKLVSITACPAYREIKRYSTPSIRVLAYYDNNTSKKVEGFTITDFDNKKLGTQTITVTYTENGITKVTTTEVTVLPLTSICPDCGTIYTLDDKDYDNGCPNCKSSLIGIEATPDKIRLYKGSSILPVTVNAVYANGSREEVTGWTSNYNPDVIGIQEVTISYLDFRSSVLIEIIAGLITCPVCGLEYSLNEDGTNPGCPVCSREIINIDVVEEHVTIEKHNRLPITVIGTFKDGHTEVITGWSTDLVPDMAGTYEATIFYQSAITQVIVTVLGEGRIHCSYCGLDYYFNDSPEGCPICSKTIVGIEAELRSGSNKVMLNSKLNLQIIIIYRDTHRSITYEGWAVDGYEPSVPGMQTISVKYQEFSTLLSIEVVDDMPKVTCPKGHEYYLNEDGSDPGCGICDPDAEKDSAIYYFDTIYTTFILEKLYEDGIYYLEKGDYFTVTVTKKGVSVRSGLSKLFFDINSIDNKNRFTFGGEVL